MEPNIQENPFVKHIADDMADERKLQRFCTRKLAQMYGVSKEEAEDGYHKMILNLMQRQPELDPKQGTRNFIIQCCANTYKDLRKRKRHPTTSLARINEEGEEYTHEIEDPKQLAALEILLLKEKIQSSYEEIYEALQKLSPIRREIIELKLMGLPYEQIAFKANIPVGTVKSRIHFAKSRLIVLLTEQMQ